MSGLELQFQGGGKIDDDDDGDDDGDGDNDDDGDGGDSDNNALRKNYTCCFRVKKLSWEDELAAYNGGQVIADDDYHGP